MSNFGQGIGSAQGIHDFFKEVEQNLYKVQYRVLLSRYRGRTNCPDCKGYRLRPEALYVKVDGKHIGELCAMQVKDLKQWFEKISLTENQEQIAKRVLLEINQRLQTLIERGFGIPYFKPFGKQPQRRRESAHSTHAQLWAAISPTRYTFWMSLPLACIRVIRKG